MPKIGPFFSDLRLALRLSVSHPGIKIVVVATLALGIGANTAMFSVLNALLFPKLPYSEAQDLVIFQTRLKNGQLLEATSYPHFREWGKEVRSLEQVAGESTQNLILSGQGEAEPLPGELVTADYFAALRINVALGRTFTRNETATAGGNPVAIISDGLWKRRFGSDASIIGKSVRLNEQPFTIIGVLPPGIQGISEKAEVWIPITMIGVVSTPQLLENRVAIWVTVIGRVNHGTSLATAQEEVNVIAARLASGQQDKGISGLQLTRLESRNFKRYREEVFILFGAVAFVLLIACFNVANLLFSHFSDRKSELAVRNALGASHSRLFQQLLLESIVLSGFGGLLGLLLAFAAVRGLGSTMTSVLPGIGTVSMDVRVLLFTATVSLLTGIFAGLLPLMQIVTRGLTDHLKSEARGGTTMARVRLRTALVIGQIGLAVVLLVGAGLLLRSMLNLQRVDLGFRPDRVLIATLSSLPGEKYNNKEKIIEFYQALLDKLSSFPQVRAVGLVSSPPLITPSPSIPFLIRGRSDFSAAQPPTAQYVAVSQGYFQVMSMRLLEGRIFEVSDSPTTEPVAIINEAMAKRYWGTQSPVGQYLNVFDGGQTPKQIVGVVANVRDSSPDSISVPEMYVLYSQVPSDFISILKSFPPALALRTIAAPELLVGNIRTTVTELEQYEAVLSTSTMEGVVSRSVAQPRLYSQLLGLFAICAVALAAIGIYGVVSYSVTQRTRELGVRMALGASREKILLLILGHGMTVTLVGILLGATGAWVLSRVLRNLLFEIGPGDPLTFMAAVVGLSAVAFTATYLPAKKASRLDPGAALRQ